MVLNALELLVLLPLWLVLRRFFWRLLIAGVLAMLLITLASNAGTLTDRFRPDPPGLRYVADSGVFLDQSTNPGCRGTIDAVYLDDPAVTLIVNPAIFTEVGGGNDRFQTQSGRLRSHPSGARIIPAATPLPPGAQAMTSTNLGTVDLYVLETALQYDTPILTTNPALERQITSDPTRAAAQRYASLRIVNACL